MYRVFEKELNYIDNKLLREFIKECLIKAPKYFYEIPASSSGKYHPKQDLGVGGLVRHTKAVVQVALDLIRCEQFWNSTESKDEIISACILHDIIKNGFKDCGHTLIEHPLLANEFIEKVFRESSDKYNGIWRSKNYIQTLIGSHMGVWNKDKDGREILPEIGNYNPCGLLVHLADYIASRKYIDMRHLD